MNVIDYYIYYRGNYQHSIFQDVKRAALESAVEAQGESVSESLLRALELEDYKADKTRNLLASVKDYSDSSIKQIHRKTNHLWHQPRLSDDEMSNLFIKDLLNNAKGNLIEEELADGINEMLEGKSVRPIAYDVNLRL